MCYIFSNFAAVFLRLCLIVTTEKGQPRKTENEFSHDRLTMVHRESDDSGNPRWLSSMYVKIYCDNVEGLSHLGISINNIDQSIVQINRHSLLSQVK